MTLTKEQQTRKGEEIAELLNLKHSADFTDRYDTSGGDKTALGLYLTVKRLMEAVK